MISGHSSLFMLPPHGLSVFFSNPISDFCHLLSPPGGYILASMCALVAPSLSLLTTYPTHRTQLANALHRTALWAHLPHPQSPGFCTDLHCEPITMAQHAHVVGNTKCVMKLGLVNLIYVALNSFHCVLYGIREKSYQTCSDPIHALVLILKQNTSSEFFICFLS